MSKIEIRNVYKIFGPTPEDVLPLVRDEGKSKEDVLELTGHTIGIKDVSLSIDAGQTFVVMGLSGSGKSTLIRHLNRLIEPTAGEIVVDGEDILRLDQQRLTDFRRHKVSMVFQRFGLFPHKSVLENVAYGLAVQDVARDVREDKAKHWIEAVGLAGYESQYPDQLSGGMQQRVGLARALATDPEILLMDEAFSALDPLIRRDMQDQLLSLQADLQKTIVFITHDLDEALRLGDRVAILNDGEIVQVASPEGIIMEPADDYVRAFVEDVNRGRVLTARSIMSTAPAVVQGADPTSLAAERMRQAEVQCCYVVDDGDRPLGVIDRDSIRGANGHCREHAEETPAVKADMVLDDCLSEAVRAAWPVPVVDRRGAFKGVLALDRLVGVLSEGGRSTPGRPA